MKHSISKLVYLFVGIAPAKKEYLSAAIYPSTFQAKAAMVFLLTLAAGCSASGSDSDGGSSSTGGAGRAGAASGTGGGLIFILGGGGGSDNSAAGGAGGKGGSFGVGGAGVAGVGNVGGEFQTPVVTSKVGHGPWAIATADVNHDGKIDLAISSCRSSTGDPLIGNSPCGYVSLLLGRGDGSFEPPVEYSGPYQAHEMAFADLGGDGNLDLIILPELTVFEGDGQGRFTQRSISQQAIGEKLAVADFNQDGLPDVALSSNAQTITVLLNDGRGDFLPARQFTAGVTPFNIAARDIDNDGKIDLVVTNLGPGIGVPDATLSVLTGNGDGTFASVDLAAPGLHVPGGLLIGDFNGDQAADLVVVDQVVSDQSFNFISAINRNAVGSVVKYPLGEFYPTYDGFAVADFDGDSVDDLLLGAGRSNISKGVVEVQLRIYLGAVQAAFTQTVDVGSGLLPQMNLFGALAAADINGDNKPDVIHADNQNDQVVVYLSRW